MKIFRKGMDIFREVLTVDTMNEIGGAVRSVGELNDRLGSGDLAPANAVLCFAARAVSRGRCVVPIGITSLPETLSPTGAVRPPLAVRDSTDSDSGSVWGVSLESADAGVAFRCAFFGFAVIPLQDSVSTGVCLAPDADGIPVQTASATRCRVLSVVEPEETGEDDPAAYALVRMDDVGAAESCTFKCGGYQGCCQGTSDEVSDGYCGRGSPRWVWEGRSPFHLQKKECGPHPFQAVCCVARKTTQTKGLAHA